MVGRHLKLARSYAHMPMDVQAVQFAKRSACVKLAKPFGAEKLSHCDWPRTTPTIARTEAPMAPRLRFIFLWLNNTERRLNYQKNKCGDDLSRESTMIA